MAAMLSISPESYWTSFEVKDDDIDFIINLLLEREVPLTSDEMGSALIELRLAQLEKEAQDAVEEVGEKHLANYIYAGNIGNPTIWDYVFGRDNK